MRRFLITALILLILGGAVAFVFRPYVPGGVEFGVALWEDQDPSLETAEWVPVEGQVVVVFYPSYFSAQLGRTEEHGVATFKIATFEENPWIFVLGQGRVIPGEEYFSRGTMFQNFLSQ